MYKFIAVIALLFTHIESSLAYNGGKQETFVPNMQIQELENKVFHKQLLEEYKIKKQYLEGLKFCADQKKYYIPTHANADSDGCYDVISHLESLSTIGEEATVAGASLDFLGATGDAQGVFLADLKCSQAYTGSRAMRYDDIKYLMKKNNLPNLSDLVYVFDYFDDVSNTEAKLLSKGEYKLRLNSSDDLTCSNYTISTSTSDIQTVKLKTNSSENKQLVLSNCGTATKIICVRD